MSPWLPSRSACGCYRCRLRPRNTGVSPAFALAPCSRPPCDQAESGPLASRSRDAGRQRADRGIGGRGAAPDLPRHRYADDRRRRPAAAGALRCRRSALERRRLPAVDRPAGAPPRSPRTRGAGGGADLPSRALAQPWLFPGRAAQRRPAGGLVPRFGRTDRRRRAHPGRPHERRRDDLERALPARRHARLPGHELHPAAGARERRRPPAVAVLAHDPGESLGKRH